MSFCSKLRQAVVFKSSWIEVLFVTFRKSMFCTLNERGNQFSERMIANDMANTLKMSMDASEL